MHSNPALEPPHAHCFAPQASADLRLLAAFAPQASADPLLLAAFAPQASAVHLRRSALCSATPGRLHSRLQSRGARRATERATPYRTRWPPYPSPSIPDGGGLGGRSTTDSSSSAQRSIRTVRGLALEPPSLRPAPRPRADSRPVARLQMPGVSPPRLAPVGLPSAAAAFQHSARRLHLNGSSELNVTRERSAAIRAPGAPSLRIAARSPCHTVPQGGFLTVEGGGFHRGPREPEEACGWGSGTLVVMCNMP